MLDFKAESFPTLLGRSENAEETTDFLDLGVGVKSAEEPSVPQVDLSRSRCAARQSDLCHVRVISLLQASDINSQ